MEQAGTLAAQQSAPHLSSSAVAMDASDAAAVAEATAGQPPVGDLASALGAWTLQAPMVASVFGGQLLQLPVGGASGRESSSLVLHGSPQDSGSGARLQLAPGAEAAQGAADVSASPRVQQGAAAAAEEEVVEGGGGGEPAAAPWGLAADQQQQQELEGLLSAEQSECSSGTGNAQAASQPQQQEQQPAASGPSTAGTGTAVGIAFPAAATLAAHRLGRQSRAPPTLHLAADTRSSSASGAFVTARSALTSGGAQPGYGEEDEVASPNTEPLRSVLCCGVFSVQCCGA